MKYNFPITKNPDPKAKPDPETLRLENCISWRSPLYDDKNFCRLLYAFILQQNIREVQ